LLLTAGAVVTVVVVVACGTATLPPVTGPRHLPGQPQPAPTMPATTPAAAATPVPSPRRSVAPAKGTGPFRACPQRAAEPADTNLHPVAAVDASNDTVPPGGPIPHGRVRLQAGGQLVLGDGRIGAGSGWSAATGLELATARVAAATTTARVTLALLDSPTSGRRVAFVEVRVRPTPPVRWRVVGALTIGTDGGDGGFTSGTAATSRDETTTDQYLRAAFPTPDGAAVTCLQRRTSAGSVDAVLFPTGWGDGGYPTLEGLDRSGRVVSVVGDYLVLPWRYAGLPGTPAPEPLG
jgi:hypothetical protein